MRTWGTACFVGEGGAGDARRQPGPAAPAGDADRVVDVLDGRPGRVREFVADRGIEVDELFTHRWKLEQADEAYKLFDTQTTGKGVFLM